MSAWKRDFASGLVLLVPVLITAYVVFWLFSHLARIPLLEQIVTAELFGGGSQAAALAEVVRVLLTLFIGGLLVFSVGYLMRTALGSIIEAAIDNLANRLPGLRVVYNATKMAVETALSGTEDLQKPVYVEPWNGMRMTAFKTGKTTEDGREVVFMPTAPNITTGFVMEVEPEDYTDTDDTVEEALTRVLSAGFGERQEQGVPIDVVEEEYGE
jgi:uncharacterized membrane protein